MIGLFNKVVSFVQETMMRLALDKALEQADVPEKFRQVTRNLLEMQIKKRREKMEQETNDAIENLRGEHERKMADPSTPPEVDFKGENARVLAALMQSGDLDPAALQKLSPWLQEKNPAPLGKRLVEEGMLSRERFLALVETLSSKILYCPACKDFQNASPPGPGPPAAAAGRP